MRGSVSEGVWVGSVRGSVSGSVRDSVCGCGSENGGV